MNPVDAREREEFCSEVAPIRIGTCLEEPGTRLYEKAMYVKS